MSCESIWPPNSGQWSTDSGHSICPEWSQEPRPRCPAALAATNCCCPGCCSPVAAASAAPATFPAAAHVAAAPAAVASAAAYCCPAFAPALLLLLPLVAAAAPAATAPAAAPLLLLPPAACPCCCPCFPCCWVCDEGFSLYFPRFSDGFRLATKWIIDIVSIKSPHEINRRVRRWSLAGGRGTAAAYQASSR